MWCRGYKTGHAHSGRCFRCDNGANTRAKERANGREGGRSRAAPADTEALPGHSVLSLSHPYPPSLFLILFSFCLAFFFLSLFSFSLSLRSCVSLTFSDFLYLFLYVYVCACVRLKRIHTRFFYSRDSLLHR